MVLVFSWAKMQTISKIVMSKVITLMRKDGIKSQTNFLHNLHLQ